MNLQGNTGITVVGFLPYPEVDAGNYPLVLTRFAALHYTYDVTPRVVALPEQIWCGDFPYIALEEESEHTIALEDFEHPPAPCCYMAGNNQHRYLGEELFGVHARVHIRTPKALPLYGDQALAIALHDRYLRT